MTEARKILPSEINDAAGHLLNQFFSLTRLVQTHEVNNEVFETPLLRFQSLQNDLLKVEGKAEFRFFENEVFFNLTRVRLLPDIRPTVLNLLKELKEHKLGGFAILGILPARITKDFLLILSQFFRENSRDYEKLNEAIHGKGISEIHFFGYQEYRTKDPTADLHQGYKHIPLLKMYAQMVNHVGTLTKIEPGEDPTVFIDALRKTQRNMQKLIDQAQSQPGEVLFLHQYPHYQAPLVSEALNVSLLAISLGRFIGFKKVELADLGMCGLFHNRARWHLDEKNYQKGWGPYFHVNYMNTDGGFNHSIYRRLLSGFHWQISADGQRGKPVLQNKIMPDLYTKIISICAQYNHLIQPPQSATGGAGLTPFNALKFMYETKTQDFDPSLLKMFINLLGIYPLGTLVQLSSGELAMVVGPPHQPQDIHRPQVIVIKDSKGKAQPQSRVNLATDPRTITRTVPASGVDVNPSHYLFTEP